jgi:hypothetical protein
MTGFTLGVVVAAAEGGSDGNDGDKGDKDDKESSNSDSVTLQQLHEQAELIVSLKAKLLQAEKQQTHTVEVLEETVAHLETKLAGAEVYLSNRLPYPRWLTLGCCRTQHGKRC